MKNTSEVDDLSDDLLVLLGDMPETNQVRDARALLDQLRAAVTESVETAEKEAADSYDEMQVEADRAYKVGEELETLRSEHEELASLVLALIGPESIDEPYGVYKVRYMARDAQPAPSIVASAMGIFAGS